MLALIFACLATPYVMMLAIELPPIQAPDEGAHYVRADQISHGGFVATRFGPGMTGGAVNLGVMKAIERFYPLLIHTDVRLTRGYFTAIPWGDIGQVSAPNTALYPPLFYLPAATAIKIAKHAGLDVLHAATVARLCTGVVSIAIATSAIALAGSGAIWLFALLLLPSSALLMAAISQDGPMLACAALAATLASRLRTETHTSDWRPYLVLFGLLLAALGAARPPYAALCLLPLAASAAPRWARRIAAGGSLLVASAWWLICVTFTMVQVDPANAAAPAAQLSRLLTHPWIVPGLVKHSFAADFAVDYAGYFIAPMKFPNWYFDVAWAVLAVAITAAFASGERPRPNSAWLVGIALAGATTGIFLIQYLTWTPYGADVINGVLGRYFLPLAAMLAACMSQTVKRPVAIWLVSPIVLAFPVASAVLALRSVILRYYI